MIEVQTIYHFNLLFIVLIHHLLCKMAENSESVIYCSNSTSSTVYF